MSFPHLDESIFGAELEQDGDRTRLKGAFLVVINEAAGLLFDCCIEYSFFVLDSRSFGDETLAVVVAQEGLDVGEERSAPGLQGIEFVLHSIFSYGHTK